MTHRCTPYPALSTKDFDTTVAAVLEPWALPGTKCSATFITGSVVYSHKGNNFVQGNALSFDLRGTRIIVQSAISCNCTLLTVGLIAWQPFYTPACFNCIIRSNVVILNSMKRHTCKIWLVIKQWTDDDGSYRRNMYLKALSCFNTNELHYIVWHIVT